MALYDVVVTCLALVSALASLGNIFSAALYVAQFVATVQLGPYSNRLRVHRVVLLKNALSSTSLSSDTSPSESEAEAPLGMKADLEDMLKLLEACDQNPVLIIIYGSPLDALLADFERVLTSNTD